MFELQKFELYEFLQRHFAPGDRAKQFKFELHEFELERVDCVGKSNCTQLGLNSCPVLIVCCVCESNNSCHVRIIQLAFPLPVYWHEFRCLLVHLSFNPT